MVTNCYLLLQHEKKTYEILNKQLGEDDPRTRESENWIKTFKVRELQVLISFLVFLYFLESQTYGGFIYFV